MRCFNDCFWHQAEVPGLLCVLTLGNQKGTEPISARYMLFTNIGGITCCQVSRRLVNMGQSP